VVASVIHHNISRTARLRYKLWAYKGSFSSENEPHIWYSGFGINAVSLIAFLDKCLLCRIIRSIRETKPLLFAFEICIRDGLRTRQFRLQVPNYSFTNLY